MPIRAIPTGHVTRALIVAGLALLLYAPGLRNSFTFDDHDFIEQNARLRSASGLLYLAFHPVEEGDALRAHMYRPLAAVVQAGIGRTFGFTPVAFHAANIALYAALVLALHAVLSRRVPPAEAWIATVLFVVHPVHTEAVASAVGITELLAALFVALAWERFWPAPEARPTAARDAAGAALVLAALLCKETSILLPLLALFRGGAHREQSRLLLLLGLAVGVYFALRFRVVGGLLITAALEFNPLDNPLCALDPWLRAANGLVLLLRSWLLLLAPWKLSADYSLGALPTFGIGWLAPALILHAAIIAVAVRHRRRWPALILGVAVFYLGLLPSANVLFCGATVFGERFLLLPVLGVALPAAAGLARLGPRWPAVVAGLVVLLGVRTVARVADWKDDLTLFRSAVAAYPGNAKANYNVGVLLWRAGQPGAALPLAEKAVAAHPPYADARVLLAMILRERGDAATAEAILREGISSRPDHEELYVELAFTLTAQGRIGAAGDAYREGLRQHPRSVKLAYNWALLELARGRPDDAEPLLRQVVAAGGSPDAYYALGHVLLARGAYAEAAEASERGLRSALRGREARENAALSRLLMGEPLRALELLAVAEPTPTARLIAAAAFARMGEQARSRRLVEQLGLREPSQCPGEQPLGEVCRGLLAR